MNSRKTERVAKLLLDRLPVRAAPFALHQNRFRERRFKSNSPCCARASSA
jgi:hypothetical protein